MASRQKAMVNKINSWVANFTFRRISIFSLFLLYLISSLWELRFHIGSSWLPIGQLAILTLIFMFSIHENKFHLYKTKDDLLVWFFIFYILLNVSVQSIFFNDYIVQMWLSGLASVTVLLTYFISRSVDTRNRQRIVILVLYLGASIYIVDIFLNYIYEYLNEGHPFVGRIIGQRIPVVLNLFFLLGLLYKSKNGFLLFYVRLISVIALLLMVISLTRSVYIALTLDFLILIFFYKGKRLIVWSLILLILVLIVNTYLNIFDQVGNRFSFMIDSIISPNIDHSASYRISIWGFIYEYIVSDLKNLFFGSGQLGVAYIQGKILVLGNEYVPMSAESQYFDVLLRGGVVGLFVFLYIFFRSIKLSWQLTKLEIQDRWIYVAIFIWLFTMIPYNLFSESLRHIEIGVLFYVVFGFLVSQSSYLKKRKNADE